MHEEKEGGHKKYQYCMVLYDLCSSAGKGVFFDIIAELTAKEWEDWIDMDMIRR